MEICWALDTFKLRLATEILVAYFFLVVHELKNSQPEAFCLKNYNFNHHKIRRTEKIRAIGPKLYLIFFNVML
jgi:hypothetical protein